MQGSKPRTQTPRPTPLDLSIDATSIRPGPAQAPVRKTAPKAYQTHKHNILREGITKRQGKGKTKKQAEKTRARKKPTPSRPMAVWHPIQECFLYSCTVCTSAQRKKKKSNPSRPKPRPSADRPSLRKVFRRWILWHLGVRVALALALALARRGGEGQILVAHAARTGTEKKAEREGRVEGWKGRGEGARRFGFGPGLLENYDRAFSLCVRDAMGERDCASG